MEADWSVEIGADLPRIVVPWEDVDAGAMGLRFVDLRKDPGAAGRLAEVRRFPALERALLALNAVGFAGMTSKCDVFSINVDEIDPREFEAEGEIAFGLGCYIDVVLLDDEVFSSFAAHETWLRSMTRGLRDVKGIRGARADLVSRAATVFGKEGFGVTLYVTACGGIEAAARTNLESALDGVIQILVAERNSEHATLFS